MMQIIQDKITLEELKKMAKNYFSNLIKAVVDIEQKIMAVDGELHADEEALLIENGSRQENLWGINIYPEFFGADNMIEYDSMINIKPHLGNRTRSVDDAAIRNKITDIVNGLIK